MDEYLPHLKVLGRGAGALAALAAAVAAAQPAAEVRHAAVVFSGSHAAELYTREIAESLQGVLRYNYVKGDSQYPAGFVRASPVPQSWSNAFWTRDGGVFLRELADWGYWDEAGQVSDCLIQLVGKNGEGYYAFPRYFDSRTPRSGNELDGTGAVIIAMAELHRLLPAGDPAREKIHLFLHGDSSPVRYIEHELERVPLLAGEGEFGGGMGVKGPWCNVVQNQLADLALFADARMEQAAGDLASARTARDAAEALKTQIFKHLVGPDGTWLWCVDPKTLKPDDRVLATALNQGFGGLNGVLSMAADVEGLEPAETAKALYAVSLRTFLKLYHTPLRQRQFDRYGIWTQFDRYDAGLLTSPSYGMGYATQDLLLFDDFARAGKALEFVSEATYRPPEEYALKRASPYYFYERMYSPEAPGKIKLEVGCGALNLVNVAEQLKVARLIVGIDDSNPNEIRLVPRLPGGWTGFTATGWPVATPSGTARLDLDYRLQGETARFSMKSSDKLKKVTVRLPRASGWSYSSFSNCDSLSLTAAVK